MLVWKSPGRAGDHGQDRLSQRGRQGIQLLKLIRPEGFNFVIRMKDNYSVKADDNQEDVYKNTRAFIFHEKAFSSKMIGKKFPSRNMKDNYIQKTAMIFATSTPLIGPLNGRSTKL
jgi:hypothetical protein